MMTTDDKALFPNSYNNLPLTGMRRHTSITIMQLSGLSTYFSSPRHC